MTNEDTRYEVRSYLASRPTASLAVTDIRHGLARKGYNTSDDSLTAALVFLEGLNPPQTKRHPSPLGASSTWQITSAGTLAHERNE
jgi:hypothetical protein